MHPLVARIHPSYRTAVVSWFFARASVWLAHAAGGVLALPLLYSPSYGDGAPLWAGSVRLGRYLEAQYPLWELAGAGTLALVVAGELALLASAIAVYRFARRNELPQTAERTTWLWMLAPVMALTAPVSSWNFAIFGVAVGLAAINTQRYLGAIVAVALAIGFRVEAILVWPGFAWMAWRNYRPAKDPAWGPWAAILAPLAAFTATVGSVMLFAGRWGMSMRGLHPGSRWRSGLAWDGFVAEAPLLLVGIVALVALVLLVKSAARDAGQALLASGLVVIWPLLHTPSFQASGALLFAVPAFVALARHLNDRSFERPLVVASVVGLMLLIV